MSQRGLQEARIAAGRPSVLVTTLPKSGTLYLGGRLIEALDLPNLQASMGRFPSNFTYPAVLQLLARGGAMTIDHIDASPRNLDAIGGAGLRRIAVHLRDPRQAALSWFHHVDAAQGGNRRLDRHFNDPALPADYDAWPPERRLDWQCETFFPSALRWIQQWLEAEAHDDRFDIVVTEHAQLRDDPTALIRRIGAHFGIEVQVEAAALPAPRAGVDHFRAGLSDEWRSSLPASTRRWMNAMMPQALCRRFGWPEV